MVRAISQFDAASRQASAAFATGRGRRAAFTLTELLVTISIIVLVLGMATTSFRGLGESNTLVTALSALKTYAGVTRLYAVENKIECMMVVNPVSGRFELWHSNAPSDGSAWDIYSRGDGTAAIIPFLNQGFDRVPNTNGYAFAQVFDAGAGLPVDSDGQPLVAVFPIDWDVLLTGGGQPLRVNSLSGPANDAYNNDNLKWVAVAFDAQGRLVQRARRIATRVGLESAPEIDRWSPPRASNRTYRGDPDVARTDVATPGTFYGAGAPVTIDDSNKYVVDQRDTLITSTFGFIVTDRKRLEQIAGPDPTPFDLVDPSSPVGWLPGTRQGGNYEKFARTLLLPRDAGREGLPVS